MPKPKKESKFVVCYDHQRRTCIKVDSDTTTKMISFIPLDIGGFEVHQTSFDSFKQRFTVMPDYPVERACELYLSYCMTVGATKDVIDYLSKFTTVDDYHRKMAIDKFSKGTDSASKNPKPAKPGKATKVVKKSVEKKMSTKPSKPKSVAKSGKYSSAAQMFRDLIMAGKLKDDKIFEKVQEEFGLDDNRRTYVDWYRKDLKKKGKNPPEAK